MNDNDIERITEELRFLISTHENHEWACVLCSDIKNIVAMLEGFIPAIDTLEKHIVAGATMTTDKGKFFLKDNSDKLIAQGNTIRGLLLSLIFVKP